MKFASLALAVAAASGLTALAPLAAAAGAPSSAPVALYAVDQSPPAGYKVLGAVREQICRKPWELPPTQADVVAMLKDRARTMGANGLVEVRFDQRRLEVRGACWQRMAAFATAVVEPQPN